MTDKNNGGPAFPERYDYEKDAQLAEPGMTLRDYFAAKVLNGLYSSDSVDYDMPIDGEDNRAELSYKMADSMLKARVK